ncbi:MAG: SDR family NAD(P)-dependent oxidoreductase, partial [Acidimicrobiaceae bacterium]|nr:SDR family NAD(P)-dependent oxidoreductase [Acidimicrobiaceae bacterium]
MTGNKGVAGQVAVVTGGGGGIGTQVALELARRGAVVVAMDPGDGVRGEPLHEPTAEATARCITDAGGTARASTASVTDPGKVAALFHDVADEFGSLDIVINTAGVIHSETLPDATMRDWRTVLDVHI